MKYYVYVVRYINHNKRYTHYRECDYILTEENGERIGRFTFKTKKDFILACKGCGYENPTFTN